MKRVVVATLSAGLLAGATTGKMAEPAAGVTENAMDSSAAGSGWMVTGDQPQLTTNPGNPSAQSLLLMTGSQLSRTLRSATSPILFSVELAPTFGADVRSSTTLEFGPLTLFFVRDDAGGRIICTAGETETEVPVAADNAGGSAAAALKLMGAWERDAKRLTVVANGVTKTFDLGVDQAGQPLLFAVSAGDSGPARIDALQLESPDITVTGFGGVASDGNVLSDVGIKDGNQKITLTGSLRSGGTSGSSSSTAQATERVNHEPIVSTLEIFTPGAVRLTGNATRNIQKSSN